MSYLSSRALSKNQEGLFCERSMTEEQVVRIIRSTVEQQFPKNCNACEYRFGSLKEYLQKTVHNGTPHSYDAEVGNWKPHTPYGTYSFAECMCGNTLVVGSSSIKLTTMWRLLWWARKEATRRDISINELLNDLREKVDTQVLNYVWSFIAKPPPKSTSQAKRTKGYALRPLLLMRHEVCRISTIRIPNWWY